MRRFFPYCYLIFAFVSSGGWILTFLMKHLWSTRVFPEPVIDIVGGFLEKVSDGGSNLLAPLLILWNYNFFPHSFSQNFYPEWIFLLIHSVILTPAVFITRKSYSDFKEKVGW